MSILSVYESNKYIGNSIVSLILVCGCSMLDKSAIKGILVKHGATDAEWIEESKNIETKHITHTFITGDDSGDITDIITELASYHCHLQIVSIADTNSLQWNITSGSSGSYSTVRWFGYKLAAWIPVLSILIFFVQRWSLFETRLFPASVPTPTEPF